MKTSLKISLLLLFVILLNNQALLGQNENKIDKKLKASYIFKIALYTNWAQNSEQYQFGLLKGDAEMIDHFKELSVTKKINNKPIKIKVFNNWSEVENVQLLYVPETYNDKIDELSIISKKQKFLLVTSECQFSELTMINFSNKNTEPYFSINSANLQEAGLNIDNTISNIGGEKIEDPYMLYEKRKNETQKLALKIEVQQKQINEQKAEIKQKKQELLAQKAEIEQKKQELLAKNEEINHKNTQLNTLLNEVKAKEKKLNQKIAAIKVKEQAIKKQEKILAQKKEEARHQQKLLKQQKTELASQEEEINRQNELIDNQKMKIEAGKQSWFLIIGFSIITLILILLFVRDVRNKRRIKQELDAKSEILNRQSEELKNTSTSLESANEKILEQAERLRKQAENLENTNQEISRSYKNMRALSSIGPKITACQTVEEINQILFEYIDSTLPVYAFGIGVYNRQKEFIDFGGFIENGQKLPFFNMHITQKDSMAAWCFKHQKPVFSNNFSDEFPDYTADWQNKELIPQSVIYQPLSIKDKFVGILTVQAQKADTFSEHDFYNIQSLCSYVSVAIANIYENRNRYIIGNTAGQKALEPIDMIRELKNAFLLHKPKNGSLHDFYWLDIEKNNNGKKQIYIAIGDYKGEELPNVSIKSISHQLLHDLIHKKQIYSPSEILEDLDKNMKKYITPVNKKFGIEMGLCIIEQNGSEKVKIKYGGAIIPLFYYKQKDENINYIKGIRRLIGSEKFKNIKNPFVDNEIELTLGDELYIATDGMMEQNNPDRICLGSQRFAEILKNNSSLSIDKQKANIEKELKNFQLTAQQRDDITLFGMKI